MFLHLFLHRFCWEYALSPHVTVITNKSILLRLVFSVVEPLLWDSCCMDCWIYTYITVLHTFYSQAGGEQGYHGTLFLEELSAWLQSSSHYHGPPLQR